MKQTSISDADSPLIKWTETQGKLLEQYKTAGYEATLLTMRCLRNLINNSPAYKGDQFLGIKEDFKYVLEEDLETIKTLTDDRNTIIDHLSYFEEYQITQWQSQTGHYDEAAVDGYMRLINQNEIFDNNLKVMLFSLRELSLDPTEKAYLNVRDSLPPLETQAKKLCYLLDPSKSPRKRIQDLYTSLNGNLTEPMIEKMLKSRYEYNQEKIERWEIHKQQNAEAENKD